MGIIHDESNKNNPAVVHSPGGRNNPRQEVFTPYSPPGTVLDTRMVIQPCSDPAKKEEETKVTQERSSLQKLAHAISTALKTPAVWAGSGAAVVCVGTSVAGVLGHTLSTVITLSNELRTKETGRQHESKSPAWFRRGYPGLVRDLVRSPGLNMAVGGLAYAAAAVQSLPAGQINLFIALSSFVIAHASATAISNRGFQRESTDPTLGEKAWEALWKRLPARFQNILKNPAPWFAFGNIMLVLPGLIEKGIASNPIPQGLLAAGIGIAAVGLGRGLSVLFTGREGGSPTGTAQYITALSSLLVGVACLVQGNLPVGIANMCWTMSNTLWGKRLDRDRIAEQKQS